MRNMVFALTVPAPEHEAVIVFEDISWPITTEATAYKLCKQIGLPGFWRRKERRL